MAQTGPRNENGENMRARSGLLRGRRVFFQYKEDDADGGPYLEWIARDDHPPPTDPGLGGAVGGTAARGRILGIQIICVLPDLSRKGDGEDYNILTVNYVSEEFGWFKFDTVRTRFLPRGFLARFLLRENPLHLKLGLNRSPSERPPTLLVILSSGAGTGSGQALAFFDNILVPTFEALDIPRPRYSLVVTKSPKTIDNLTRQVIRPRAQMGFPQTIILLSGDGGVQDIVNALLSTAAPGKNTDGRESFGPVHENVPSSPSPTMAAEYTPPTLGILALGTANAMAHSYRLLTPSSSVSLGLQTILLGSPCPLPLFHAAFSPGAEVVLFGSDEAVPLSRRTNAGAEDQIDDSCSSTDGIMHGAVVLSYGYHAAIVADSDTPQYRSHGVDRFKMAANDLFYPADGAPPPVFRAKISVLKSTAGASGVDVSPVPGGTGAGQNSESDACGRWVELPGREHALALTTLVSNLEFDYVISPKSSPPSPKPTASTPSARRAGDDNDMYFVHVRALPGSEIERLTYLAYQGGKHVDDPEVGYEAIEGIRIELLPPSSAPLYSSSSPRGGPNAGPVPLGGVVSTPGSSDRPDQPQLGNGDDRRLRKICVDGTIVVLEGAGKGWVEMRRGVHPSLIPEHSKDFVAVNFLSPAH